MKMESLLNTKTELIIDSNPTLSEDVMFGYQLAKNPAEWYRFFNQPLPKDIVKSYSFDGDEFDNLFGNV